MITAGVTTAKMSMMLRHVPVERHSGIYYSERSNGSRSYEVRYRDSNGKTRFQVCGPLLRDALDKQAKIRTRLNEGERVAPNQMRFADLVTEWQQHRRGKHGEPLAPRTTLSYDTICRLYLVPGFGNRKIQSVSTDDIALFLRTVKAASGKPLAPNSRRLIYAILNDILTYAANRRRGYISSNPCRDLDQGERPAHKKLEARVCTSDEADGLMAHSPEWLKPILQTALLTGMRQAEILGLQWRDVNFATGEIHVRQQLSPQRELAQTKGKRSRTVPLVPALRATLWSLPTRFAGGFVFLNSSGRPFQDSFVRQGFIAARRKARITDHPRPLRFHDLRHTYGSVLLQDGKDITWVSELLGHASVNVTLGVYAHVVQRQNRAEDVEQRLGAALGGVAK